MRRKYKIFDLPQVTTSGGQVSAEFRIEANDAQAISAIAIDSDRPDLLTLRGRVRIEIAGDEIFDDRFPAKKILVGGQNVPCDQRLSTRQGEIAYGNGVMKVRYQDTAAGTIVFAPYQVAILLEYQV